MAGAAALDPDLIDWELHDIEMQMDDASRSRLVPGKTVQVAREVDALAFMQHFYERLGITSTQNPTKR